MRMELLARLGSLILTVALAASCTTQSGTRVPDFRRGVSFEEGQRYMEESGAMRKYIASRPRPGGRWATPKYAARSWDWFVERRVEPDERALPLTYREDAYRTARAQNMDRSTLAGQRGAAWTPITPGGDVQPSGRLIEMVVHPQNDSTIFAASASGGVWKTTNRGQSWTNVTDGQLPTIGMGSLAMDPTNPNVMYTGLGEGVPGSHYEPYGAGIYKTSDGGSTWTKLGNSDQVMSYVTDIAVLGDSNTLLAVAAGAIQGSAGGGIFRSTNGGQTWTTISNAPHFSISVDPSNRNNVVVTSKVIGTDQGPLWGRIYYSTNGGQTFTAATIPANGDAQTGVFRIELTRNGQTMYALAAEAAGALWGIWKSSNGGQSWSALPLTGVPLTDQTYKPGQMYFNCAIQVSPFDVNTVYFGSNLRMYKSTDGGSSWAAKSDWAGDNQLPYVHADHHSIRFGANNNIVYFCTDGGFFVSTDGGTTWSERNIGMTALQIYRIDNHPTNANAVAMGLQDNDKYVRRGDGTWRHYPNSFGDCMEIIAHPSSANTFMGANYYGSRIAITENGSEGQWNDMRMYGQTAQDAPNGIPSGEQGSWISPFLYDPLNPNDLYIGLNAVYRTTYQPGTVPNWTQIIPGTTSVPRQMESMAITYGPSNRKLFGFLGRQSQSGLSIGLWRSNLDGSGYEDLMVPQTAWVSAITADPSDNNTLWMSFSNVNNSNADRGRIYRSTNLGTSWTDMTNDFPRGLPVSAVLVDPDNSNTILLGSDIGIFRSDNGGQNWVYWNDGMPPVVVTDFAYFPPTKTVRVGTYGRGMFETPITPGLGTPDIQITPDTLNFD